MILGLMLLLGLFCVAMLWLSMDLPGLENHHAWVKALAFFAVMLPPIMVLVLAMGWGKKPERTAHWWRLKIAAEDIMNSYQPIVYARINSQAAPPAELRIAWLKLVADKLDSQVENPILLGDDVLLEHWRAAQNNTLQTLRIAENTRTQPIPDPAFFGMAEGIIKEVMEVQAKEILFSDQPGAVKLPKKK